MTDRAEVLPPAKVLYHNCVRAMTEDQKLGVNGFRLLGGRSCPIEVRSNGTSPYPRSCAPFLA